MFNNSFAHRRRFSPGVVVCVVLTASCGSVPVPTSPLPILPSTEYRVSGIVMDAAATPIADATVMLRHSQGALTARTNADGAYAFAFHANQPYQQGYQIVPGDFLGLLIARDGPYWGDIGRGHWTTVQLLPWGTPDVAQNVRLRPVRTLVAGQSMGLSVEPDSSLPWNGEWDPWEFPSFTTLREEFFVSVQTDGLLTIDARSEAGGNAATLKCAWCPARGVQGTSSIQVEAGRSPYYFSIEIPRASAPQQYEIQTSLR